MNYKKVYDNIIKNAQKQNRIKHQGIYLETHHIIPRCMGGDDKKTNLVNLTGTEHFICHKLLCKIYPVNNSLKFGFACMFRGAKNRNFLTARQYQESRTTHLELCKPTKDRKTGYHHNDAVGKLTQQQKQTIHDMFIGTLFETELIGKQFGISRKIVIRVLKEFGLDKKQIKSFGSKKREMRRKLKDLTNGTNSWKHDFYVPRPEKASKKQSQSIKDYWNKVHSGEITRRDKCFNQQTMCIETGQILYAYNTMTKDYIPNKRTMTMYKRDNPNKIYHWKYINSNGISADL